VVSYRVMLDVPADQVRFVSRLLAAHRRKIGTRKGTRRLTCYKQALFGLAWFRDKGDIPRLGAGFGLPQSTAYRYLDEIIEVLAARAPGLQEALERALAAGAPYLILDGKVVDTDRCREKTLSRKGKTIDVWYAGKTHDFGGNIQALFYPSGIPLWVSDVLPGNVHDLAAARAGSRSACTGRCSQAPPRTKWPRRPGQACGACTSNGSSGPMGSATR
jgi:hypothetical protein